MSYYRPKAAFSSNSTTSAAAQGSVDKDKAAPADATDTISAVRWSPASNHLAAASWDGNVRVYDMAADLGAKKVAEIKAGAPLLTCDWTQDGTIVAGAGADKKVHLLAASNGQTTSFAAHDAPIRSLRFVNVPSAPSPVIATGSWDKTVRYWDIRNTGSPLGTLNCKDRIFSMDAAGKLLVIATAEKHIQVVDMQANPTAFRNTHVSELKYASRVVTAFPDATGYALGGIEGRCSLKVLDDTSSKNFTFRCHRHEVPTSKPKTTEIWAVNDINCHPVHSATFTTAGSDGTFHFWDRVAHSRLRTFPKQAGAITSTAFNRDGKVFAYAIGYDWAMGYAKNSPDYPLKLMLHPVSEDEVKPRRKQA